ncbi:class I SAM-dependent methyltransferase [Rasiella sp. SM2506]|uniref:class I SAM-dependent methyltransferase n=1 Tax=Rasiella sp. SM2506 TaxID=3423914 RepID=UPI003D7B761B
MVCCILCRSAKTSEYFRDEQHCFFVCDTCTTVFRHPETWITPLAEKERYLAHKNDVEDPGYQKFVSPLVEAVSASFPSTALGLDFGAGTGPVVAKLLREQSYSIVLYDPFFHTDTGVLEKKYDFVFCCEVIEHFHHPLKEFKLLKNLLKPDGKLFCMTNLWAGNSEEFESWWYKNDSTHTLFYNPANLKYIQENCDFKNISIKGNCIKFN